MANYDWNIRKFVENMLPTFYRIPDWIAWLYSLVYPIVELKALFDIFRTNKIYDRNITGQVIQLERLLNDLYDNTLRRIYISDTSALLVTYRFNDADLVLPQSQTFRLNAYGTPSTLTTYRFDAGIIGQTFTIYIPTDVTFIEATVRAEVDKRKLAGKKYNIVTF